MDLSETTYTASNPFLRERAYSHHIAERNANWAFLELLKRGPFLGPSIAAYLYASHFFAARVLRDNILAEQKCSVSSLTGAFTSYLCRVVDSFMILEKELADGDCEHRCFTQNKSRHEQSHSDGMLLYVGNSLRVRRLGKLEVTNRKFHNASYIFPKGYAIERSFWSTRVSVSLIGKGSYRLRLNQTWTRAYVDLHALSGQPVGDVEPLFIIENDEIRCTAPTPSGVLQKFRACLFSALVRKILTEIAALELPDMQHTNNVRQHEKDSDDESLLLSQNAYKSADGMGVLEVKKRLLLRAAEQLRPSISAVLFSSLTGEEFFGFADDTIGRLIELIPGAAECIAYSPKYFPFDLLQSRMRAPGGGR